jgi:hypothetical protein
MEFFMLCSIRINENKKSDIMIFFHRSSDFTKNAFFLRSGRIKEAPDSPIAVSADGKRTNAANGGCRQTAPPFSGNISTLFRRFREDPRNEIHVAQGCCFNKAV